MVDSSAEGFAIEATGDPEKLDEFIDVMRSYGEIEVTRSGAVAMSLDAKKLQLAAARAHQGRSSKVAKQRRRTVTVSERSYWSIQWQNAITKKTETSSI